MIILAGIQVNMAAFWLIAMVVLLVIEALVPGLVSIWFAVGALASLISAMVGAPMWLQIVWFFVVSIAMLALTRPLAKKYVNSRIQPTNADVALGKDCIVLEDIDNIRGTGAVSLDGKVWTARMLRDDALAAQGNIVRAVRIEGVKLIVENK